MNWRKSILISFLPLLAFLGFVLTNKQDEKKVTKRTLASIPMKQKVHSKKLVHPRVVAAFQGKVNQNNFLRNRIPQSVESTLTKDPAVKITKGYEFLKDVGAISKKDYKPEMGEIIQERNGFVFFKANSGHPFSPVAISRTTNNLYPIASILHIKGATMDLRNQVLAQGYKEYYYHAPFKFLSIKSEASQVLRMYSELKEKGFQVELEVLKPKHQTI